MNKDTLKKEELIKYELPFFAEFISNDFIQNIIARLTANKVKRKFKRYEYRRQREVFFNRMRNNYE